MVPHVHPVRWLVFWSVGGRSVCLNSDIKAGREVTLHTPIGTLSFCLFFYLAV